MNPNHIIQQGYFDKGHHIEDQLCNHDKMFISNIKLPKRVNWNEYFSYDHHVDTMKQAIQKEHQATKRYKELLNVNLTLKRTRTEL